jgi:hypothetical protein
LCASKHIRTSLFDRAHRVDRGVKNCCIDASLRRRLAAFVAVSSRPAVATTIAVYAFWLVVVSITPVAYRSTMVVASIFYHALRPFFIFSWRRTVFVSLSSRPADPRQCGRHIKII